MQVVALGVLLIAAANAVGIITVKVLDGRTEAAVRASLGAGVLRVGRPYAIEAGILSAAAGLLAIVMAVWTLPLVRRGVPPGIAKWIAGWDAVGLDVPLALGTWSTATLLGVAVGFWSGIRGARGTAIVLAASDARAAGTAPGRGRHIVVALQAGLSVVLLSAAVLFGSGLENTRRTYTAFEPDGVLLARATAPPHRYPDDVDVVAFFQRSVAAARELPGVRVAGLVRNPPASNVSSPVRAIWPTEAPPEKGTPAPTADVQVVDPRGLAALGIRISSGRAFRDGDTGTSARVALVSRQLAARLWSGHDPLGRSASLDDGSRWQIVGIVDDIRVNWYDGGPRPTIYLPHAQTATRGMTLVLRAEGSPATLAAPLRAALQAIELNPPPIRTSRSAKRSTMRWRRSTRWHGCSWRWRW